MKETDEKGENFFAKKPRGGKPVKRSRSTPSGALGLKLSKKVGEATYRKTAGVGLKNARANRPHIRRGIDALERSPLAGLRNAVVVSAGPSLHLRKTAERLKASSFQGVVVAADGALGYCLRNGVVPDVVVCLDPHPTRIVRWFGDPRLEKRPVDDYFRRQDLDPHVARHEASRNRELIALVNRYGPRVKAVLSTSVSPSVTERVLEAGMPLYWWNPIYDDYERKDSLTRKIFEMTKVPCLVTGGNCGAAAWAFAGTMLGAENVAVTGMDFSYHPDTPLSKTQYFKEFQGMLGKRVSEAFIRVWNPHLRQEWYTDPTYWWYREVFLSLARQAPFETFNCTEGGILFGKGVRWTGFDEFLGRRA